MARTARLDAAAPPGLADRVLGWRDRLLASPGFRRWAARFPPTRPIARRRARALFDLAAGFVYAQVLLAGVRLRLFEILAEGPARADAIGRRVGLTTESAARLLDAAVALRLAARRSSDRYGLGPLGAALVDNPAVLAMVEHHPMLYADLADPVALLRGEAGPGRLARYWPYSGARTPDTLAASETAPYSTLMAASQALVAAEILDAYPLRGHRRLLDVGGGDGAFLVEAGRRWPHLELALFDLPTVAERARARLDAAGLGRARVRGGDFLVDDLVAPDSPESGGPDVVALVRVVHDHDDAAVLALLRAAHRALAPGGCLLLAEPMARTPGAEPMGDAYFGFYLLAMGQGRPRSAEGLTALLETAGFASVRRPRTSTPLLTGLLVARKRDVSLA